jgi:hypothetical protein
VTHIGDLAAAADPHPPALPRRVDLTAVATHLPSRLDTPAQIHQAGRALQGLSDAEMDAALAAIPGNRLAAKIEATTGLATDTPVHPDRATIAQAAPLSQAEMLELERLGFQRGKTYRLRDVNAHLRARGGTDVARNIAAKMLLEKAGQLVEPGQPLQPHQQRTPDEERLLSYGFQKGKALSYADASKKLQEIHGPDVTRRIADLVLLESWGILED